MKVAGLANGISPTAVVSDQAHIGNGVSIGHYAVVESGARLEEGVQVGPMAVICGSARLGHGVLVFPHAVVGADPQITYPESGPGGTAEIGAGTVLREGATVHRGSHGGSTVLGADCLVMASGQISHDCRVGDGVVVGQGAGLGAHVTVGDHATIGVQAGVHQWVRIGALAMVGPLARATRDILPMTLADGNPALHRRVNSVALSRHGVGTEDQAVLARLLVALSGGSELPPLAGKFGDIVAEFLNETSRRGLAVFARSIR